MKYASQPVLPFDVGYASHAGKRPNQEDNLGVKIYTDSGLLAVLSDGMGGHAGGEIASELAVRTFGDYFPKTDGTPLIRLDKTLHKTDQALANKVRGNKDLQTMGATLIALYAQGYEVSWISVGDSLLYHFRRGQLDKLNTAHTLGERFRLLLENGSITLDDYKAVDKPHALTSALGPDKLHEIDSGTLHLQNQDLLIIASDGLLTLNTNNLMPLLNLDLPAQTLAETILQAVLDQNAKHQDNTSLIVIRKPVHKKAAFFTFKRIIALGSLFLCIFSGAYWFFNLKDQRNTLNNQSSATTPVPLTPALTPAIPAGAPPPLTQSPPTPPSTAEHKELLHEPVKPTPTATPPTPVLPNVENPPKTQSIENPVITPTNHSSIKTPEPLKTATTEHDLWHRAKHFFNHLLD